MSKTQLVLAKSRSILTPRINKHVNKRDSSRSSGYQNRLVAEANKIFTFIARLQHKTGSDLKKIQKILLNEIESFEEKIRLLGFDDDNVFVSYYALNICIEEVLKTAAIEREGKKPRGGGSPHKSNMKLADKQRFFIILDKMCKASEVFVDQLEFIYICLNLGFNSQVNDEWQPIINSLYNIIRAKRGEVEKQLSSLNHHAVVSDSPSSETNPLFFSIFKVLLMTLLILFGMYYGTDYLFQLSSEQFSAELQKTDQDQVIDSVGQGEDYRMGASVIE